MKATDIWTIRPAADPRAVIRGDRWRVTVLTSRLLRLEYAADGTFRYIAGKIVLASREKAGQDKHT